MRGLTHQPGGSALSSFSVAAPRIAETTQKRERFFFMIAHLYLEATYTRYVKLFFEDLKGISNCRGKSC